MTTKNDGGPAFPNAEVVDNNNDVMAYAESGMTLRDYFAAKALVGLLSDTANVSSCAMFAKVSYQHADAMLLERAK